MDHLIPVPETPPLTWLYENPEGHIPGQKLQIDLDTGRVHGRIVPPPGSAYIGAGAYGYRVPERFPDETFSDFHVGVADFIDESGAVVTRQVGSIATEGGHGSQSPNFDMLAAHGTLEERVGDANEWLQRRGPYAHLIKDLAIYGRVSRDEDGALVMNGAAYPWLSKDRARGINATTHSAEIWDHPDHAGQKQFIGVARVHTSSLRNDIPEVLAADRQEEPFAIMCWKNEAGEVECGCPEDAPAEPVAVMAEVTDSEFDALRGSLEALTERLDRIEAAVATIAIDGTSGATLTLEARVDALVERLLAFEALTEQLEAMVQNRVTPAPEAVNDVPL